MLSLLQTGHASLLRPAITTSQSLRLFTSSHNNRLAGERYREWHKQKTEQDPEWRRLRTSQSCELRRKKMAEDPEFRQSHQSRCREWHALPEHKARYLLRARLYKWCTVAKAAGWIREQLPWKTHSPVLFAEGAEVRTTCGPHVELKESKLFWKAHGSKDYLCNGCYGKQDLFDAMPAGYEDCKTITDLAVRMKQLDGINPKKLY